MFTKGISVVLLVIEHEKFLLQGLETFCRDRPGGNGPGTFELQRLGAELLLRAAHGQGHAHGHFGELRLDDGHRLHVLAGVGQALRDREVDGGLDRRRRPTDAGANFGLNRNTLRKKIREDVPFSVRFHLAPGVEAVPTADGVRELQNRRVEITYGPGSGM